MDLNDTFLQVDGPLVHFTLEKAWEMSSLLNYKPLEAKQTRWTKKEQKNKNVKSNGLKDWSLVFLISFFVLEFFPCVLRSSFEA